MNLLGNNKTKELQNFKNPFDKDGVNSITFHIHRRPSMFRDNKRGEATIYFTNGNTEGKQTIYADDFQDLVKQVDTFINSLK
jgi:antitoxin component YwqK of YwqJK toxin-antitoxin module